MPAMPEWLRKILESKREMRQRLAAQVARRSLPANRVTGVMPGGIFVTTCQLLN